MPCGGITSPSCWSSATLSSSSYVKRTINSRSSTSTTTQPCSPSGGSESNGFHRDRVSSSLFVLWSKFAWSCKLVLHVSQFLWMYEARDETSPAKTGLCVDGVVIEVKPKCFRFRFQSPMTAFRKLVSRCWPCKTQNYCRAFVISKKFNRITSSTHISSTIPSE